ncbi:right-handed parallel beta-helix repeat-containing protein, partial [Methanosarcina mazei]
MLILLGIFLILSLISGIGSAAEIIVQPGDSIQAAIDSSKSGDTITIKPGTYTENVNITKSSLLIRSESGNPDDTIIKAKSSSSNALSMQAWNVTIKGIKTIGASGSSYSGIYMYKCNQCVIENNKMTNNGYGIRIVSSNRCTVSKNTVLNNGVYGIYLGSCSNNTISGNTATNDNRGIHVGSADDNTISDNTVTSNNILGMYVCGLSDRNLIYNNYFNNTNITIKNGTGNAYNTAKASGKNIVGGTYIGGNFWGKPDGSGFSNKATDTDRDGISDSAYSIPGSIYIDHLPLVVPAPLTAPGASFSSNVTSGTAPLNVLFTDTSTGSPTTWKWNFGDGTSSTQKSPTHAYSTAGTYTVTLTVTNSAGSNTATKTNYVTVTTGTTGTKPVLQYWGSPRSGIAPLTVTFKDNSSGSPTAWNWSFGDGAYSNEKYPKHTYTAPGSYTISLTASNAAGSNTLTKSNYIVVTGTSSQTPVAAFSASPTAGTAPLSVSFTDSSTGSPTTWKWNFGDGTSSTEKNPVHTYSTAGSYTVTLTASNTAGSNTATKSSYVTVTTGTTGTKPVLQYWGSPRSGTAPLTVTFKDNSSGSPTAWNWSFGDGAYSNEKYPKHTYMAPGSYTISLTASNAAGSNTLIKNNYIVVTGNTSQAPVAAFSASPTSGTAPLNVLFTDTSTGSPTTWKWNFGDGTSSTQKSPTHA